MRAEREWRTGPRPMGRACTSRLGSACHHGAIDGSHARPAGAGRTGRRARLHQGRKSESRRGGRVSSAVGAATGDSHARQHVPRPRRLTPRPSTRRPWRTARTDGRPPLRRAQVITSMRAMRPSPLTGRRSGSSWPPSRTSRPTRVSTPWKRLRSPSNGSGSGRYTGDEMSSGNDDKKRLRVAQEHVARARRELNDASHRSGFDPADVELLEATHAEVLAAWEAGEGSTGGRARLRLDGTARAAERAVLGRMGLASYAEFMVASTNWDSGSSRPASRPPVGAWSSPRRIWLTSKPACGCPRTGPGRSPRHSSHFTPGLWSCWAPTPGRTWQVCSGTGSRPTRSPTSLLRWPLSASPSIGPPLAIRSCVAPAGGSSTSTPTPTRPTCGTARAGTSARRASACSPTPLQAGQERTGELRQSARG